ncbi:DUF4142 domain-containing protein [Geomonas nitrogeniifigens]|uniref:DUF4142 domain-containing protein n=1 Tax=Geomonas diazotrophica TaxID=2843197 RepID=A0ABX8JI11_9BACT|nr:DUF4142 domain-containing protein [Geomonas nitrogeniifigens]QWV96761.1 DUF4142 domain-containing protein [Geomonas nitrogeniifigens]
MKRKLVWMAVVSLFAVCSLVLPALAAEKLTMGEKSFVKEAASSGMMEVELGQMAKEKGKSQEVKDFGQMMATDHGKANDELKSVAGNRVKMPTKLELKHKATVDKLSKASVDEFDKKYAEAMLKDHKKDVEKFKKESKKVKDPELKGWIDKTLPVLEQHLQHAREMARKLGVAEK